MFSCITVSIFSSKIQMTGQYYYKVVVVFFLRSYIGIKEEGEFQIRFYLVHFTPCIQTHIFHGNI